MNIFAFLNTILCKQRQDSHFGGSRNEVISVCNTLEEEAKIFLLCNAYLNTVQADTYRTQNLTKREVSLTFYIMIMSLKTKIFFDNLNTLKYTIFLSIYDFLCNLLSLVFRHYCANDDLRYLFKLRTPMSLFWSIWVGLEKAYESASF